MRPQGGSLRTRLLLGAAVLILLALLVTWAVLSALFNGQIRDQYAAELTGFLDQITARLDVTPEGAPALTSQPNDARFAAVRGGRYWQIEAPGAPTLRSRSLWDATITLPADLPVAGEVHRHLLDDPTLGRLLAVERVVRLDRAPQTPLRVVVAMPESDIAAVTRGLVSNLAVALAVLGVALTVASAVQVAVGLEPLARVRQALTRVRDGREPRLGGSNPAEVQPLVDEVNALLDDNAAMVQRAGQQAADLAHALKTPLQLLGQEAEQIGRAGDTARGRRLADQVVRMRAQIDHQLARVRVRGPQRHGGQATEVKPIVEGLAGAMRRVHAARRLTITSEVPAGLRFRGSDQDLEEVLGNVIDNACKWARSNVQISGRADEGRCVIEVDDDGPGLDPAMRETVFARGRRLDEVVPGTGLGLAIVRDVVELYGGSVDLDTSPLGGLRTRLELPGA